MNNETKKLKSKLEFEKTVKEAGYKQIGEYINTTTKVLLICPNNHKYMANPSHFKNGTRCPKCSSNCKEIASKKFYDMLKIENYKCYDEYSSNKVKVLLECPNGHIFKMRPNDFMTGHRCKICSQINCKGSIEKREKSFKDLKELANKKGYEILGEYINSNTKIKMKCPNGHISDYNIGHFKAGHECPVCNANSIAEKSVYKLLTDHNVNFEFQKSFDDLKGLNGGQLKCDFYFPDSNTVLEIHGEQHYNNVKFFFNNKKYNTYKKHDEIKRNYFKNHNIKLIELAYLPINSHLEKGLEKLLNQVNRLIIEKSI